MPSPLAPNNSPVIQVEPPQGQSSLHSQAVLQQSAASAAAAILFVLLGAHPNADEMLPGSSGLWLSQQVQRGSSGSVGSDASSVPPTVPRGHLSVGVQSAWLEPDATPLPVAPTVRYRSAQDVEVAQHSPTRSRAVGAFATQQLELQITQVQAGQVRRLLRFADQFS